MTRQILMYLNNKELYYNLRLILVAVKPSLIDSEARWGNEAQG